MGLKLADDDDDGVEEEVDEEKGCEFGAAEEGGSMLGVVVGL